MNSSDGGLKPYLTPLQAWAFAMGTSLGWGSLVITSTNYLAKAGPMGSILGLAAGMVIMLVIARNYFYMISAFPEAGGVYTYSRDVFGYDYGFLTAWFLMLTYLAVLWANTTSLPLFARYFLGNVFRVGYLYTIFGYEIYLGEVLLASGALVLAAVLCMYSRKMIAKGMVLMVLFFTVAIIICFIGACIRHEYSFEPYFIPYSSQLNQVIRIACISPWAFIGFENISHFAEEFDFPRKKVHGILVSAVIVTTLLYGFLIILSTTAYPPQYDSWLSYIRDIGSLSGIEGLPAFYAARHYMGQFGVTLLIIALLTLVVTSLFGNTLAVSRLFYAMARDRILPEQLAQVRESGIPWKAVGFVAAVSVLIPFLGRTAIGWIVDVTTIGATLVYGFVSAAAMKIAKDRGDSFERITGILGLVIMIGFGVYLLVPNLFMVGSMETESYFLFVIWSILGFFFFRHTLSRDKMRRFGQSIVVWIVFIAMILFISLVWMNQSVLETTSRAMDHIHEYYRASGMDAAGEAFIDQEIEMIRMTNARSIIIVVGLFAVSLWILINNYLIMRKRTIESEIELGHIKDMANTDPLTGVKSKHAFVEKEKNLDSQIGAGEAEPFAIVVCDVNGLKYINDTFGHKAGDEYIRSASRLVCEVFQHSPVYRIGGDEFVVCMSGRDYEQRDELMNEINRQVEANIEAGAVVVAAGLSVFDPEKDQNMHQVFERADTLMYQRKQELKAMGARTRS